MPAAVSLTSVDGSSFPGADGGASARKRRSGGVLLFSWFSAQPPATAQTVDGSRKEDFSYFFVTSALGSVFLLLAGGPRWLWCVWPLTAPSQLQARLC